MSVPVETRTWGDGLPADPALGAREAKKLLRAELERRGSVHRLTARTVNFSGFGYDRCVFVKVHGWEPGPLWGELQAFARRNGFRIET